MSRVLIVTSTDLEGGSVGAQFIRALTLRASPDVTFVPMVLRTDGQAAASPLGPLSQLLRQLGSRIGLFNRIRLRKYRVVRLSPWREAVLAKRAESEADVVWITLSSPELIFLAEQILLTGTPLKVTVWDAPEYLAESLQLGRYWTNEIMCSFKHVLETAVSVSVVGERMMNRYADQCRVRPIVLRLGVNESRGLKPQVNRTVLRLVYAGSLYAKEEWNSLISALESVKWIVQGRPVVLYFVGNFPRSGAARSRKVVLLGAQDSETTLRIIGNCDIAYLPYWFSKAKALAASTSFPGKMSAYVAAGTPVLFHGPSETEVSDFLERHPVGNCCHSLGIPDILRALDHLMARRDSAMAAMAQALNLELSADQMAVRFASFIEQRYTEEL